jgi:hypothetical protein
MVEKRDYGVCRVLFSASGYQLTNKQTPWPLVRERTIPNERRPLLDEI